MNFKACLAECIATLMFVFIGVGSVVAASGIPALGGLGPALAHGLAIAVLAAATSSISGGQLNPAVTIGLWLGNQISLVQAVGNILSQVLGAIVGVFALVAGMGAEVVEAVGFGLPARGGPVEPFQAMFLEGMLTFVLVLVVFGTMVDRRAPKVNTIYVGLTITAAAVTIGPFTGACLNPARYLGPAIAGAGFADVLVYMAGPILGGAIAGLVYTYAIGKVPAEEVAA